MRINPGEKVCVVRIEPDFLGRILGLPQGARISALKVADFEHGDNVLDIFIRGYGYAAKHGELAKRIDPAMVREESIHVEWPKIEPQNGREDC